MKTLVLLVITLAFCWFSCDGFIGVKPLTKLNTVRRRHARFEPHIHATNIALERIKTTTTLVASDGAGLLNNWESKLTPQLSINILMLLFYSSLGAVMPYIPLYYRRIGITDAQIGLLGAITPAATFIVSPLWGALADATGLHKNILIATFVGSVLLRCLMGFVDNDVVLLGTVVALSAILFAPVKPLLDSVVLNMLEDKSVFGKSRLWGQVGFGVGSFLVGPLLGANIKLLFLAQAVLALPTMMLMLTLPTAPRAATTATSSEQKAQMQYVYKLLRDPSVWCFFVSIFVIGLSSGIIENFAYVKIAEVSGSGTRALTVSRLLSSLSGGPMFYFSGSIIKAVGTRNVMAMTLLSFVARFAMYASITRGWHAIPAEILRGVFFALFWSAATTYVYEKSPKGMSATMLGLLNGIHGGLGQSIGSLIGGEMVRSMGISAAFNKCAVVDGSLLASFLLSQSVASAYLARQKMVPEVDEQIDAEKINSM